MNLKSAPNLKGFLFLRQAVRERVPAKVLWVIRRLQPKGAA